MVTPLPSAQAVAMALVQGQDLNPAAGDEAPNAVAEQGVHVVTGLPEVREGAPEGAVPAREGVAR